MHPYSLRLGPAQPGSLSPRRPVFQAPGYPRTCWTHGRAGADPGQLLGYRASYLCRGAWASYWCRCTWASLYLLLQPTMMRDSAPIVST